MPIAPSAGTVVVNPDGTITFTPLADFIGSCAIGYRVIDGVGQTATAQVNVTVNAPPVGVWPNGYAAKGEVYVGPDSESMTGFELLLDITDDRLKLRSAGGAVYSSSGHDVRLEDGADNAVPYARLLYDGTAGRLVAIVKRDRGAGSSWNKIEVYAGKSGASDQANPASALAGLLACIRMDTGTDLTGNGRNLTVSGASATTLFGLPGAAQFDRIDDIASLADPSSWLNGLSTLTLALDLQLDQITVDGGALRVGGAAATDVDSAGFVSLRPDATSFYANPAIVNFWFTLLKINIGGTPTFCRVEGAGNTVPVGQPTTVAVAWQSGQAIGLVADDAVQTPAYASPATPTGTLVATGGPLAVGAGPRGWFGGRIGLLRIASSRRSNAWMRAEQRNRLYPRKMIAAGAMRGPSDSTPCIAYPDAAAATGADLTLSPLANDSGSGLSIVSASAERGTVTVASSTTLTYRQPVGYSGTDHVTYTIQDAAGRQSTSLVTISVSGTPIVPANDAASTSGTAPVVVSVLDNDVGTGLAVIAVATPAHGSASVTDGGTTVTYTANLGFSGGETPFAYTVEDDFGQQRTALISVTVLKPPLIAVSDVSAVVAGATDSVVVPSLANDTGTGAVITAVGTPSIGSATIISSGTRIRYLPPAAVAASTEVSFTYTLTDAYGQTATGTITVTVTPVGSPVVANDDTATATVGVQKTLSPLANDTGSSLTISTLGTPSNSGTATRINGNTQVQYTPSAAGLETINYTAQNGSGATDTAVITVTVSAAATFPRHPPTALRTLRVSSSTYATLADAHAAAQPGDHVEFENGTYGTYGLYDNTIAGENTSLAAGNHFVWTKAGTAANPIVLKSRNGAGGVIVCHLDISAQHVWLYNLTCRRSGTNPSRIKGGKNDNYTSSLMWGTNPNYSIRLGASNAHVTNCLIESPNDICVPSSSSNIDICYNDIQCRAGEIWSQSNGIYFGAFGPTSRGSDNVLVARNKWWNDLDVTNEVSANDNDGRYCVYTGNNEPQNNKTGINRSVRFIENFVDVTTIPVGWYFKRDYYHLRNFIRAKTVAFNQRHGGYSKADGTAFTDLTDATSALIVGNNFDKGIFRLNDGPRLIVSCRMGGNVELYYGGRRTDGPNLASYTINANPGYTQAASYNEFVGCSFVGNIRAGEDEGTGTKPWKVWGAAEETKWASSSEPHDQQGDRIKGIKIYAAGVTSPAQPTEGNDKFVRLTNAYGEQTVASGTSGFQSLSGDNGRTALLTTPVTRAELEFATGRLAT
jgi:hypothetical protein